MKEDGEAIEGLIPKIESALQKYTKGAVTMIDKENGGLRSTYEVLNDLSKVYDQLDDEARAYLNEVIAANRQSKVLVSIMSNWRTDVLPAIDAAKNSLGSANEENLKYINSIVGLSNKLISTWQKIALSLNGDMVIKNFLNMAIAVSEFIDTMNLIPIALTVSGIGLVGATLLKLFSIVQNGVGNMMKFAEASKTITMLNETGKIGIINFTNAITGLNKQQVIYLLTLTKLNDKQKEKILLSIGMTKEEIKSTLIKQAEAAATQKQILSTVGFNETLKLNIAMIKAQTAAWITSPMGLATIAIVGIMAIAAAIDYTSKAFERQIEKIEKTTQAYKEHQQEIDSINDKLKTTEERLKELYDKQKDGTITIFEESEITKLEKTNKELQIQLELLKAIAEQEQIQIRKQITETYQTTYQKPAFSTYEGKGEGYVEGTATTQADIINQQLSEMEILKNKIEESSKRYNELSIKAVTAPLIGVEKIEFEQYRKDIAEFDKLNLILKDNWEKLNTLFKGQTLVVNPVTIEQKNFNEALTSFKEFELSYLKLIGNVPDTVIFEQIFDTTELQKAKTELEELGKSGKVSKETIESYNGLSEKITQAGYSVEGFVNQFNSLQQAPMGAVSSIEEFTKAITDLENKTSLLSTAQKEYDEKGFVSIDIYTKLIALGEEYSNVLFDEKGNLVLNKDAWEALVKAEYEKLIADKMLEKGSLTKTLEEQTKKVNELSNALSESSILTTMGSSKTQVQQLLEQAKQQADLTKDSIQGLDRQIAQLQSQKTGMDIKIKVDLSSISGLSKSLENIRKELTETKKLSISSLQEMVSKYPELADAQSKYLAGLISEQDVIKQFENLYKQDLLNYIYVEAQKIITSNDFKGSVESVYTNLIKSLGLSYNGDLKNFIGLMDAKAKASATTAQSIANQWGSLTGILAKASSSMADMKARSQMIIGDMEASDEAKAIAQNTLESIKAMDAYSDMAQELKNFSISAPNIGGGSSSKSGSSDKKFEDELSDTDKLQRYTDYLNYLDKALEQIRNTLQDTTINFDEFLKAQEQEAEILSVMRDVNEEYLSALRVSSAEMEKVLKEKYGADIEWQGNMQRITNIEEVIGKRVKALNNFIEANQGKTLSKEQEKEYENLKKAVEDAKKVTEEYFDLQVNKIPQVVQALKEITKETSELKKYNDQIAFLNAQLDEIRKTYSDTNISFLEFLNLQEKEYELLKKQHGVSQRYLDDLKARRTEIENILSKEFKVKINVDDTSKLDEALARAQKKLDDFNAKYAGKKLNEKGLQEQQKLIYNYQQLASLSEEYIDINVNGIPRITREMQNLRAETEQAMSTMKSKLETVISMTINMLKQQLNDQIKSLNLLKDSIKDNYDTETKGLENIKKAKDEQYKNDKKALDDELEAARKRIQNAKDLLKLQEEARSYQRSLAEKQKAVADIESELLKIQFDDSVEAMKKRKELESELAKTRDDLNELQHGREIDLAEQALDKELKRIEELYKLRMEALDNEKEKQDENYQFELDQKKILYDLTIKNLDNTIKRIQDDINNEYQLRLQAISMLESRNQQFYDNLIMWNRIYGTHIDADVTNALEEANSVLNEMGNNTSIGNLLEFLTQKARDFGTSLKDAWANFNYSQVPNPPAFFPDDEKFWVKEATVSEGTWENIIRYHDGGIVGNATGTSKEFAKLMNLQSNEVPAVLKTDEVVATRQHQSNILNTVDGLLNNNRSKNIDPTINMGDIIIQGNVDDGIIAKIRKVKDEMVKEVFDKFSDIRRLGATQNLNRVGI